MHRPDKAILIVDDAAIIVSRLRNILEAMTEPVTIFQAGNAPEALSSILIRQPDIVLLDINLPGHSGIELLRQIKLDNPKTIVIMLSNQSGDFYRARCSALGADYFIDKSTEFDKIPSILLPLLGNNLTPS